MAAAQLIGMPVLPVRDCTALDESAAVRLGALLKVLGEPAPLRLLSVIQAQPTDEACVCHRAVPGALNGVLQALGGDVGPTTDSTTSCANDCRRP